MRLFHLRCKFYYTLSTKLTYVDKLVRISQKVAFAILIAILIIPTTYFALLFLDVVSRHEYQKEAVVQVRLTSIQYVIDSPTVERGSFVCSLIFSNPTHEALNLRVQYVNFWASPLKEHGSLMASGSKIDHIIGPGTAQISVELELDSDYAGDVLLAQHDRRGLHFVQRKNRCTNGRHVRDDQCQVCL